MLIGSREVLAAFNLMREADRVAYMIEDFDLQDQLDAKWERLQKTFQPLLDVRFLLGACVMPLMN